MKPIQLSMTAFGPYPHEEIIDFEALKGRYLFLITGPTGSGKTTLFDAMSYAIYGESSGSMRPSDSFRSQFATEDELTTVTFEFELHGHRYKVERIPKQWRPKSVGEGYTEQKPEATLYFLTQSKRPVSGVTQVTRTLEELIGLSEEQFKQIMMIPQGEFRQLLVATSEEREKVLKRLFDTTIYRQIQERLAKRASSLYASIKDKSTQRDALIGTLEWSQFYDASEWEQLQKEPIDEQIERFLLILKDERSQMKDKEQTIKKQQQVLEDIKKKREHQNTVNQRFDRLEELSKNQKDLEDKKETIVQMERMLEKANKAERVSIYEKTWRDRLGDYEEDQKAHELSVGQLKTYEEAYKVQKELYEKEQSEASVNRLKELEIAVDQWERLTACRQKLTEISDKYGKIQKEEEEIKVKLEQQEQKIEKQKQAKTEMDQWKLHLATYQMEEQKLRDNLDKLDQQESELERYEEMFRQLMIYQNSDKKIGVAIQANQEKLNIRREQFKSMRQDFLNQQGAILAAELEDGKPCPVCGSLHHPKPMESSDHYLSMDEIEAQENALHRFEEQLTEQINQQTRLVARIEQIIDQYDVFMQWCNRKGVVWSKEGEETPVDACKRLKALLNEEKTAYKKQQKQQIERKQRLDAKERELKGQLDNEEQSQKRIEEMTTRFNALHEMRLRLEAQREQVQEEYSLLCGRMKMEEDISDENMMALKKQVESTYQLMLKQRDEIIMYYEKVSSQREQENVRLNQLTAQLQRSLSKMNRAKKDYDEMRFSQGFVSEEEYKKASLTQEVMEEYKEKIEEFYARQQSIKSEMQTIQSDLQGQEKKELASIDQRIHDLEIDFQEQTKTYTLLNDRLMRTKKTLDQVRRLHQSVHEEEAVYKQMGFLANYAQGRNPAMLSFERFALAAFLEDILDAANSRLKYMTDGRYQMKRSHKLERKNRQSGLDIDIYDYYSGKSRSIKTLSGGESFKASLSMALGLSDVVQSYAGGVRLDTMFIDEGFGTLDQESLDSAIACLAQLKESGRLVGIISHVQELKERIPTQLRVQVGQSGSYTEFVIND